MSLTLTQAPQGYRAVVVAVGLRKTLEPGTVVTVCPDGESDGIVFTLLPDTGPEVPASYELDPNYPNPFNPTTVIPYRLPASSYVDVKVYTLLGQEAATLVAGLQEGEYRSVEWNGSSSPSGVYYCRFTARDLKDPGKLFTEIRKLLLLR